MCCGLCAPEYRHTHTYTHTCTCTRTHMRAHAHMCTHTEQINIFKNLIVHTFKKLSGTMPPHFIVQADLNLQADLLPWFPDVGSHQTWLIPLLKTTTEEVVSHFLMHEEKITVNLAFSYSETISSTRSHGDHLQVNKTTEALLILIDNNQCQGSGILMAQESQLTC